MATANQQPGVLNVSFVRGESWGLLVDFDEPSNLVGYTFESGLYSPVNGALAQAVTTTAVDLAAGKVNLSLTAAQTAALPAGTYEFRVSWGPTTRRVYQGFCEVLP